MDEQIFELDQGSILGRVGWQRGSAALHPYSGKEMQDKVCGYLNNVKDEVQRAGEEKRAELEERLALLQSGKI